MRSFFLRALSIGTVAGFTLLSGCSLFDGSLFKSSSVFRKQYEVAAYKPHNPDNVRVQVSLQSRMVYVMEGSRPLLVTPTTIGKPGAVTPTGSFHITDKVKHKRSNTYGFWARGNDVRPGTSDRPPGGGYRYVGYPMGYWVEFKPAYGFHQGPVWPIPHSHGCLRLHANAAPKFFALVHSGTPVSIAQSQPEDATLGKKAEHPSDYNDPDPAGTYMISDKIFEPIPGPLLQD
jgi:hypothetical protein